MCSAPRACAKAPSTREPSLSNVQKHQWLQGKAADILEEVTDGPDPENKKSHQVTKVNTIIAGGPMGETVKYFFLFQVLVVAQTQGHVGKKSQESVLSQIHMPESRMFLKGLPTMKD